MTALLFRRRKLGRTSCREISRFSQTGIKNVRNDQRFPAGIDMVFRWGCTSNLPAGIPVINTAEAIHRVADKAAFRKLTADAGLAPKTWLSVDAWEEDYCEGVEAARKIVVRRATHHQGRFLHTFTYDDNGYRPDGVIAACARYGEGNYYISEFIPKVAEYRVFMVSGRVVWVAQKTPGNPEAVAWNVAQGGRFDNVRWDQWPLKAVRVAREAFLLSSLDFGGVDVMVDAEGEAYVLEINSAPSQTSPYRQEATAKAFDYIVNYGKDALPVTEDKGGWRKFIHPAISNEAIIP